MIVANGSLFPFSGAGIQTMLAEETDAQLMAVAHNVENDTPQALSDKIKYALSTERPKMPRSFFMFFKRKILAHLKIVWLSTNLFLREKKLPLLNHADATS